MRSKRTAREKTKEESKIWQESMTSILPLQKSDRAEELWNPG